MIHAYSSESAQDSLIAASGKESAAVLFDAKKIQEQPNVSNYDEYVNAMREEAELYFLGEEDIDTAMGNFNSIADRLRSEE